MSDRKPAIGTLHLVNKAPDQPRFVACMQALSSHDVVVLAENAVLACADSGLTLPEHWLALEADVEARGLQSVCERARLIDYDGLVRLTENHHKIITW